MNHNWLLWSIPLAIAGLILLLILIVNLIKTINTAELLRVPLNKETVLDFTEKGRVQMHLECSRRLISPFFGLHYEIKDTRNQQVVPISRLILPLKSSGVNSIRLLHGEINIPQAGRYSLRITGLQAQKDYRDCRIIFTRPYSLIVILHALGITVSGGGFILGVVMSLIYLVRIRGS